MSLPEEEATFNRRPQTNNYFTKQMNSEYFVVVYEPRPNKQFMFMNKLKFESEKHKKNYRSQ